MSKVREFPFGNGLVEIQMEKRAKKWWRRNKDGVLYASLIFPIVLAVLMMDVLAKHPRFALGYLIGVGSWYTLFGFAQGRKKPRMAVRGRETGTRKHQNFLVYSITDGEDESMEVSA